MSTIYDRGRDLAIRQLAPISQGGKGQVVTLTYTSVGEYDPDAGEAPTSTTTQTGSGVEKAIKVGLIDGSTILAGDSWFVLSPVQTNGQDLALPDKIPLGTTITLASGQKKQVVDHEPKRPSGLLISDTLHLRGAG